MSPNITPSWVLALAPEIGLLVVLFCVLIFEKLFKPSNPRQVGLFTAWGGVAVLLLTAALFWLFQEPNRLWTLSESVFWGGMMRNDLVTFVFRLMFLSALILTSLLSLDVPRLRTGSRFGGAGPARGRKLNLVIMFRERGDRRRGACQRAASTSSALQAP